MTTQNGHSYHNGRGGHHISNTVRNCEALAANYSRILRERAEMRAAIEASAPKGPRRQADRERNAASHPLYNRYAWTEAKAKQWRVVEKLLPAKTDQIAYALECEMNQAWGYMVSAERAGLATRPKVKMRAKAIMWERVE